MTHETLRGWSFVAATLTLLGSPAILQAAQPEHEAAEARSSTVGTEPPGPVADWAPEPAPDERTVTTVTTVTPEHPAGVSLGTAGTTVEVRTTIVHRPPMVHHHHYTPPPVAQPAAPQPAPPAVLSVPRYASHPYAAGVDGYVQRVPWPTGTPAVGVTSPPGRLFSGQVSLETAHAGHGVLRNAARLRLAWWRIGVEGDVAYFLDRSATERPRADSFTLARTNVVLAPVLRPRLTVWVGGGANTMVTMRRNAEGRYPLAYGYNLTSSVDVFPVRPLVVSGRVDLGRVGEAPVFAARGTVGLILSRFEFYGGYEYMRVGERGLRGPMFGGRVWF